MPERNTSVQEAAKAAIEQKAQFCLACEHKSDFLTGVPRHGVLQVRPENVSVRVNCVIAGENTKPCPTSKRREQRIAHHLNKPAFAV